jgi:hypothetical protein
VVPHFHWEPKTPFRLPRLGETIKHQHVCEIQDCPEKIEVRHSVLLAWDDRDSRTSAPGGKDAAGRTTGEGKVARFLTLECDSVESWICDQLSRVTQDVLFEKTYLQVAREFKTDYHDQIKSRVAAEALRYGLSVKHFSSVPNIETVALEKGFQFHVDGEFGTKNPRFKVKLSVVGDGRIITFDKIASLLRPGHNLVVGQIQPCIRAEVEKILHGKTPEEFYLQFQQSTYLKERQEAQSSRREHAERTSSDVPRLSVETELTHAIVKVLYSTFQVEDCHVTVKQVETELTERMRGLVNEKPAFDLPIKPNDGLPLNFHVEYRVMGLVPQYWDVFLRGNKKPADEIADITHLMKETCKELLDHKINTELAQYETDVEQALLKTAVSEGYQGRGTRYEGVRDIVERHHGLSIEVSVFRREASEIDIRTAQATVDDLESQLRVQQSERRHLENTVESLQTKESAIMARSGPDDPELGSVRQAIAEAIGKLDKIVGPKPAVVSQAPNLLRHTRPKSDLLQWSEQSFGDSNQLGVESGEAKRHTAEDVPGQEPGGKPAGE